MPKVPVIKNLHQKVLKNASKEGALDQSDWECGSTRCRAGHIVHAAGKRGYALKDATNWAFAAMQISKASGLPVSPTQFLGSISNEDALADMKRMAELEAAKESTP